MEHMYFPGEDDHLYSSDDSSDDSDPDDESDVDDEQDLVQDVDGHSQQRELLVAGTLFYVYSTLSLQESLLRSLLKVIG